MYNPYKRRLNAKLLVKLPDGLQAVQQAKKLQHELILLDLGLPTMNRLQAARRIRELSPNSKILFVSQNASPEIAQRAIQLGAYAYLLKSDTSDLALAVEAVLGGEQFVSSRLKVP